jgi:hypothetical protein
LRERLGAGNRYRVFSSQVHHGADPAHALALLRTPRERPRSRAAEQRDELATLQLSKLHLLPPKPGVRA